ncbi:DUF6009 family protein [Streptomyces sp. NPDC008122]|uniref:DUF6009 family protein n=1 Tax=Streptomyces sp. NPDC008122 TaxID=3364810 RepID=UPI0036E7EA5C
MEQGLLCAECSAWCTPARAGASRRGGAAATSSLLTESDLVHEEEVVRREDLEALHCVRQARDKTRRRNTKSPYAGDGRTARYALLYDGASPDPGCFLYLCWVFFLATRCRPLARKRGRHRAVCLRGCR